MSATARTPVPELRQLDGEAWLANRLSRFGVLLPLFDGLTTTATRRARFREVINGHKLELVVCGSIGRKPYTYAQAFERLYGEPL
jgi:hypothetical protein